jgi:antitoxin HicB
VIDSRHIGSTLESFLREENRLEEARATALKRVLAWQIEQAMQAQRLTKTEMARRMHTSRTQLDRLLDPNNDKVLLQTMQRAAAAIGKQLNFELVDSSG